MTDDHARLCERLRSAFMKIQAAKRGDAPISMQLIWDLINLQPDVLAILDRHEDFERDLAAEEAATLIESLSRTRDEIRREAFEEAARIADFRYAAEGNNVFYQTAGVSIAKAIREHIKGGDR